MRKSVPWVNWLLRGVTCESRQWFARAPGADANEIARSDAPQCSNYNFTANSLHAFALTTLLKSFSERFL